MAFTFTPTTTTAGSTLPVTSGMLYTGHI